MASEDERDAADGARSSTSGSAKRVKTAGGSKSKKSSNMISEDERDAADGARPSTRGSAKRVKTAGGTESKKSSNMTSEDERDAADGARPSTRGSAKRVKTAGGTKSKRCSNMSSKAKRDAADVASARQSTSGSARGVKTAGGTKRKRSSNMASEAERVAANDSGPSTSGSAMSARIPGGTELDFNDPWTARILVTAIAGVGMYLAQGFVTFLHNYPELVRYAVKVVFRPYGEVEDIKLNSITVDLACGSAKKFLKFKKDFEDGKVKVALERELKEIGCDPKLELKLELKLVKETPNVVAFEVSEKTMTEKTRKIFFANPNSEDEEEKESDQEAVKDGEPDNKELSDLAEEVTEQRGKLGQQLNVPQKYLEQISVNHKGDAYEMAFQVLLSWRKNSSAISKYQELFDALIKIGCRDLAKKYCCY